MSKAQFIALAAQFNLQASYSGNVRKMFLPNNRQKLKAFFFKMWTDYNFDVRNTGWTLCLNEN